MTELSPDDNPAARIVLVVALGAFYGGGLYLYKALTDPDVRFQPRKFAKTIGLFALAGVLVGVNDDALELENFESAVVTVTIMLDQVWNQFGEDDSPEPPDEIET